MEILLITYDISDSDSRRSLRLAVKQYDYKELCESDYAIKTDKSCKEVRDELKEFISSGDKLFVCKISNWAGYKLPDGAGSWLND
jgi:hypothetical protein